MNKLENLKSIAEIEFKEIVKHAYIKNYKLRIILIDGSFIEVVISQKLKNKFSFHWECLDNCIYRYDNFPDKKARKLKTFPYHFHNGNQENIVESQFSKEIVEGFREFLTFVSEKIKPEKQE